MEGPLTEKLQFKHRKKVFGMILFFGILKKRAYLCESKEKFEAHPKEERLTMMIWLTFSDLASFDILPMLEIRGYFLLNFL